MNPYTAQQSMNIGPLLQALGPVLSLFPATAPIAPFVMAGGTLINSIDTLSRKPYMPTTASPGMGFAMGGSLHSITDGAIKVQGNPNVVDSVQAPLANLDDGEVVYGNFVFSKRLTNVQTGRPFSEDAEDIVRKIAKLRRSKGNLDAKTISKLEMLLGKLALEQEKSKQLLLTQSQQPAQQVPQQSMAFGGQITPPGHIFAKMFNSLPSSVLPTVTISAPSPQDFRIPMHPRYLPPTTSSGLPILDIPTYDKPDSGLLFPPVPYRMQAIVPPTLPTLPLPTSVSSIRESTLPTLPSIKPSKTPEKRSKQKYTDADKLQALALVASAVPLLRGPEVEQLVLDRSTYTRDQLDPRAALQASSRLIHAGLQNANSSVSPFVRQALINSLISTGLGSQAQILDDYRRNNLQALRTFETQVAKTEQDNVRSRLVNLEANAQNRAAYLNDMQNFLQSLVNFASQLNQRKQADDYFEMLKRAYAHLGLLDDSN